MAAAPVFLKRRDGPVHLLGGKMEKPSDSKEKRKHPRVETNKSVTFRVDRDPGTSLGMIFNASRGGLLLSTFKDILIGTRIVIEIVSPKGDKFAKGCVAAEIIWKDMCLWDEWEGYQYGIKFIQTSNKSDSKGAKEI